MNEEELKKGCGKEFYTHNRIILVKCGTECKHDKRKSNQIHLCPTCQARLEGFQKGKLEQKKEEFGDFIKWLDWLINSPKNTWSKQIKTKLEQLQKEIGDNSQQPRMKQTRGGELKSDEGLHSTDNGSPADTFSREESEDICICGHHTKDHSYDPNKLDADLECDICDCKGFKTKEDRGFLGGYAEFWDNPGDDRWDKEEEKTK